MNCEELWKDKFWSALQLPRSDLLRSPVLENVPALLTSSLFLATIKRRYIFAIKKCNKIGFDNLLEKA